MTKRIPHPAKQIMMAILENDGRIATDIMLRIAEQHMGKAADDAERRARQAQCQQLMASVRDADGMRMVFHVPARASIHRRDEYVLLSACTDPTELQAVRHRLYSHVTGLEHSLAVVESRIRLNNTVRFYLAALDIGKEEQHGTHYAEAV